jgi:hypothetical protein
VSKSQAKPPAPPLGSTVYEAGWGQAFSEFCHGLLGLNTSAFGGTGAFAGGNWTASFDITSRATSVFSTAPTFTGANAASVTGAGSAVTTLPLTVGASYIITASLTDTWGRTAGTPGLVVGVPKSSLDANFVPEPGTLPGTGGALVMLRMVLRRRIRKR